MATIGLFYGSTTSNTANCAKQIASVLGDTVATVQDISQAKAETMMPFDTLILGTSTWGYGEQQDDWQSFESELTKVDWQNKKVALFGLGDQYGYSDTFVDAMGLLHEALTAQGATIVGAWAGQDYEFESSVAHKDGTFVGLALDEDNQSDLTESRIALWVTALKGELGL
ncbi:MAG: flavodoxin [Bacteroidales bacterium]|nr:flavodoxin [Bacteroidales bacterium]